MTDLQKAKKRLAAGDCTCVARKDDIEYVFTKRGVSPLLDCLAEPKELCGFFVADKVVGKAAALLYVLLQVRAVYAEVISEKALVTLQAYGIETDYRTLVPAIRNRTDTGFCPMESAVWQIEDPATAYAVIQKTLAQLQGK